MKKTNVFKSMLGLAVAATMSAGFTSCGEDDEVVANPTSVSIEATGGTQIISVLSNTEWTVSCNANWLTVSPMQGSKNGTITVTASANNGEARNSTLYIYAGDAQTSVTVNQPSGITPPPPLVGTWKYSWGSDWCSFTFNSNGTGAYNEYANGHWDSYNETFTYTYSNNMITLRWDEDYDVETIPVRSLTATELVMNWDDEGFRTFYKQ